MKQTIGHIIITSEMLLNFSIFPVYSTAHSKTNRGWRAQWQCGDNQKRRLSDYSGD